MKVYTASDKPDRNRYSLLWILWELGFQPAPRDLFGQYMPFDRLSEMYRSKLYLDDSSRQKYTPGQPIYN